MTVVFHGSGTEVEGDPPLGATVNVLAMANMFEATVRYELYQLVFTRSETVYGASQDPYGDRPIVEEASAPPRATSYLRSDELLNEFIAEPAFAQAAAFAFEG